MPLTRRRLLVLGSGVVGGLVAGGCTAAEKTGVRDPTPGQPTGGAPSASETLASPSTPASGSPASPSPTPSSPPSSAPPAEARLPRVRNRRSLPALMRTDFGSERPERGSRLARTSRYTKYAARYPSGDLTISGVLYVPRGDGPFPAVVLNHGYIEPSVYRTGQGMAREQDYLASRGFVVLHTDYRGHAGSSRASALERELRLGYTADAINAAYALKDMPQVDPDKVAMFGRSMGGGVTYNALVTAPGVVRCGVVWAPVSSSYTDNYNRWTRPERRTTASQVTRRWGEPDDDKPFYADLSARTFFDRITEPVRIEHGTADRTCPIRWSDRTARLMERAGVDLSYERRRGQDHTYYGQWGAAMADTHRFLRKHLDL